MSEGAPIPLGRMPGRYAFLRESRWIGLIAAMIVVSVVCVFLGRWQWHRHEDRSAFAAQISAAYEAPVAPLGDVLDGPRVGADQSWRRVDLGGEYLEEQVVLRARPVDGTAAVHVLSLFEATSSAGEPVGPLLLVVDRGWLPAAIGDEVARGERALPEPPAGPVDLTARLRLAEEPGDRPPSPGATLRIEPGQVIEAAGLAEQVRAAAEAGDLTVLDGYAQAAAEATPAGEVERGPEDPEPYARPSTQLGNNLSYAFQWWFFAIGAQVAWLLLARREADEREEELLFGLLPGQGGHGGGSGGTGTGAAAAHGVLPAGARRKPRARTLDDEVEDAAVDAMWR